MFNYLKRIKGKNKLNYYVKLFVSIVALSASIIGIVTGIIFCREYFSKDDMNLVGNWEVEFITKESSYKTYIGMSLIYKLYFSQKHKNEFDAIGETYFVNGKVLPSSRHRKLTVKGTIRKGVIKGTYILVGGRRESYGIITAKVSKDGLSFNGRFDSTAANAKGIVIGTLK